MKNDEEFTLNVENFTKCLSNEWYELWISIWRYEKEQFMRTKYVIDEYFDRDFDIDVLVVNRTKYVMTFFTQFVNYRAYDVVIVSIE